VRPQQSASEQGPLISGSCVCECIGIAGVIVTGRAFSYWCKFVFDKLDWWLEV